METLQLFTAQNGSVSAKVVFDNGTFCHIHSTVNPYIDADLFESTELWGNVLVFLGVGLGYHLHHIVPKIQPHQTIIAVDFYDECIDHCLTTVLKPFEKTIVRISSNTAVQEKTRSFSICQASQSIQVIRHPAAYSIHKDFYRTCETAIFKPASLHPAIKKNRPAKALVLYGSHFLQPEVHRAFISSGIECTLFRYPAIHNCNEYALVFERCVQESKPDFVVSINLKGLDGNGLCIARTADLGIPVVVWFVDDPHPMLLHMRQFLGSHMIAFCWEKRYVPFLREQGFSQAYYLPLATDPTIFSCTSKSINTTQTGFVGSAMGNQFIQGIQDKYLWTKEIDAFVDTCAQKLLETPSADVFKLIHAAETGAIKPLPFSDVVNMTWLRSHIIHLASQKRRMQLISTMLPHNIKLFGDPIGWHEVLGPTVTAYPDVDYTTQLCPVYQSLAVVVNSTNCQMPTAVNQRVFDVPMSGSFLVTDNQSDMAELFEIGSEAIVYRSYEECAELTAFYCVHASDRKRITSAAIKRITGCHTYTHRVQTILDIIAMAFAAA